VGRRGAYPARRCLSSSRPEFLTVGGECGSDEHEDGEAKDNFAQL
jgi:hypothetical protein